MTCAITCSFASSHGMREPLHQICSLALMAIEPLLELVLDCSGCQGLSSQLPDAAAQRDTRCAIAVKKVGHRGLSLTGNYNRGTRGEFGRVFYDTHATYDGGGPKKVIRR